MFVTANGMQLFYQCAGSGPPLLLIHGNGDDHSFFADLQPALAQHYTVYALDSRNHGQSSSSAELHYAEMMEDIAAFIRALALPRPLLVGASDGGILGLMLSYTYPDLLAANIPCGANMSPRGIEPAFLRQVRRDYQRNADPKLRLMLKEPQIKRRDLAKIRIPTLVLAGSEDLIKPGHSRALAAKIPTAALQILDGEDHTSYLTHHSEVGLAAMLPFLAAQAGTQC